MLFLWLGLAGFFAFIAFRSFTTGSYLRGGFASFAVVLFGFAIWISFQPPAAERTNERASERAAVAQASDDAPDDPFSDR